jgi:hypothetical protein
MSSRSVAALRVAHSLLVLDHGGVVWRGASRDTSATELGTHFLETAVERVPRHQRHRAP